MGRSNPVAVFMAATAILATNAIQVPSTNAGPNDDDLGGLKEWTTDQSVDDKSKLDKAAKKAAKKAKEEDICIPIGEGENCW